MSNNQTDFDVIVVGGGPSGATAAHEIALAGHRVLLLERAFRIKPCGGAIPPCMLEEFDIPRSLLKAEIQSARMISPTVQKVDMPIEGTFVGMVDRDEFDPWLRSRAQQAGAELELALAGLESDLAEGHGPEVAHHGLAVRTGQGVLLRLQGAVEGFRDLTLEQRPLEGELQRGADGIGGADLIMHQRDQRRDNDTGPLKNNRRQLIAERLARPCRHHSEGPFPRHDAVNDLRLHPAKGGEAEGGMKLIEEG